MRTRILVLMLAAGIISSCGKQDGAHDAHKAKADSMKTAYVALVAAMDAAAVDELGKYVAENAVDHNAMPGQKAGLAGLKEMVTMWKSSFSDVKTTVEKMYVDGDILIAHLRWQGTNTGPMMPGMPATNKKVDNYGVDWTRWENGKFVERWGAFEEMKMMEQLGLMPAMGGAPAPADSTKK